MFEVPLSLSLLHLAGGALSVAATYRVATWLHGAHDASRGMTLAQALVYQDDPRPAWRDYAHETLRLHFYGKAHLRRQRRSAY